MASVPSTTAGPAWPENWPDGPARCETALAWFDTWAGLEPDALIGRWRGLGLPTGHPMDGVLESLGWYGKTFESADSVRPLLFRTRSGTLVSLDPRFMPVAFVLRWPAIARSGPVRMAFRAVRGLLRSEQSAATLQGMTFRGVRSAAITYSRKPITDHLRRIDDDRLLGLMEMRGMEKPYFFLLARDQCLWPGQRGPLRAPDVGSPGLHPVVLQVVRLDISPRTLC